MDMEGNVNKCDKGALDMKDWAESLPDVPKLNPKNECSDDEYLDANDETSSEEGFVELELSEEELKEKHSGLSDEALENLMKEADEGKNKGNECFKDKKFEDALKLYTDALNLCPLKYTKNRSVLYSNRAAAKINLDKNEEAVLDCNKAIDLDPTYLRAILRRAQLLRKLDHLDKCLEDYQKILALDKNNMEARGACATLPAEIEEKNEKMKKEMFGKLKDLGNICLKPFGLSTENFNVVQDPTSGGYSVNFQS